MDDRQKQLWLTELHLNGFVVLPRFLPVDLVEAMRDELAPLLEAEHAKAEQNDWGQGRARGRLSLHIAPYADILKGTLTDARYRANPVIEELVDAILGQGRWKRGWTVVEAVWRGAAHMSWHSDQKIEDTPDIDAPHQPLRLTFNIPLVDFTWASGAIELIPGSHRLPRRFGSEANLLDLPNIHWVRPPLVLGDAMLRDGNTLHRGSPNLTDRVRPMLDQTYKVSVDLSG